MKTSKKIWLFRGLYGLKSSESRAGVNGAPVPFMDLKDPSILKLILIVEKKRRGVYVSSIIVLKLN
jgi:hypothetical protein